MASPPPSTSMLTFNQEAVIADGSFTQIVHNREDGFKILQQSVAKGAFHNSGERFDPPKCHEKTRKAVLKRILDWVFRQNEEARDAFVMWLHGPAGAGKSAIMQTIAERLDASHRLVASFFFTRNHPTRGHADRLIATIAYQLALILPPGFRESLVRAVEHDPLIFSKTLDIQFLELIGKPMEQLIMSGFSTNNPYLIVIDGLDECRDPQIQSGIVDLAFKVHDTAQHLPLLFLIASRPELEISLSIERRYSSSLLSLLALDDKYCSETDIQEYLQAEFEEIKKTHPFRSSIPDTWPPEDAISTLVSKSSGQFIYAATVIKYVTTIRRKPVESLEKILGLRPLGKDTPFAELDSLYTHILCGVDDVETVLLAIGIVLLPPPPKLEFNSRLLTSTEHIEQFLSLDSGSAHFLFQDLRSLISISSAGNEILPFDIDFDFIFADSVIKPTIRILHASLGDFLFDKSRSQSLWVNPINIHTTCVNRCLELLQDLSMDFYVMSKVLSRLNFHFPLADPDLVAVENAVNFSFDKFLSFIHDLPHRPDDEGLRWKNDGEWMYPVFLGLYLEWVESIPSTTPDWVQYRQNQMKAFDHYLSSHLDVYFSNRRMLFHLLASILPSISFHLYYSNSRIDDVWEAAHIDIEHLNVCRLSFVGSHMRYARYTSGFLRDPRRAGQYFLTGSKYAEVARFGLSIISKTIWLHPGEAPYPEILERQGDHSGWSKELVDLARTMKLELFQYMTFPSYDGIRKAIEEYLARMENEDEVSRV